MNIKLEPGKYIVAVSGGVDSVVLLDLLRNLPGLELVVAHFDHGIRTESHEDAALVEHIAYVHGLPFAHERAELGSGASEDAARRARYDFLERVRDQHEARAIVTAHHQDDLLETAIHNLRRGTGRRGLTSLKSTPRLQRPLLGFTKAQLIDYALKQGLSWHEDTTNYDQRYTRNYIRHQLRIHANDDARQQLLTLITRLHAINDELDGGLRELLQQHTTEQSINRRWFASLPQDLAQECLASWLRQQQLASFDRKTIERLTIHLQTKATGKQLDIMNHYQFTITKDTLALRRQER